MTSPRRQCEAMRVPSAAKYTGSTVTVVTRRPASAQWLIRSLCVPQRSASSSRRTVVNKRRLTTW